jgi:PAS domain S-box-containing protein
MSIIKDMNLPAVCDLRLRAEEKHADMISEERLPPAGYETERLLYELQVHQIELETQNAELLLARNELEAALERYTDLYDFAPVGYVTLDSKGNIRAVNIAGACLIGGVRSQLIGRRFGLCVAALDRPVFTKFLGKVLASQIKASCEVALLNKAKQTVFVQIEAMATASGHEFRLALIDITARRLAEDALASKRKELEELNSSLEVRIAQTVDDLRRSEAVMIRQDRRVAMGEMINFIAHQWRQPLNTLGLYLQELPVVYDTQGFSKEYLETIIHESMQLILHMSRTIDDFRDYFRSDKEKESFSVNQVIVKTLSLIEKIFNDQRIYIALQTDGDPVINGYPNEYAQVLMNIMMNSRDAIVERKAVDGRILIRSFAEGGKVVVTVTDNAGGIANEIVDKLFDPYFTTKGPDAGTGIGLFMSKTIIEENMGGKLTFQNRGSGAEFRIEV